ncbi:MAG: hypothetical protein D4R64_11030 [Porphyromonadaceae bacterium]|nr:MAG: hypothetical protein D4R64_11030 [Porphyromonadaceae bacterium]
MKKFKIITIIIYSMLVSCDPVIVDNGLDETAIPANHGSLEFKFILPAYKIPPASIHRISLSFAYSVDSLYRGQFFQKVNVSDFQEMYTLFFLPDEYYYDAVITCSCAGDTCLNGGFPGGQFGMKHNFNKFSIINQENTIIETHFQ